MAVFAIGNRPKFQFGYERSGELYYFKKGKSGTVWNWDYNKDFVDGHIQLADLCGGIYNGDGGGCIAEKDGGDTYYNLDAAFLWPKNVGNPIYSGLTFLFWSSKDTNNYQWTAIDGQGAVYYGKWGESKGKVLRNYMGNAKGDKIDNPFFSLYNAGLRLTKAKESINATVAVLMPAEPAFLRKKWQVYFFKKYQYWGFNLGNDGDTEVIHGVNAAQSGPSVSVFPNGRKPNKTGYPNPSWPKNNAEKMAPAFVLAGIQGAYYWQDDAWPNKASSDGTGDQHSKHTNDAIHFFLEKKDGKGRVYVWGVQGHPGYPIAWPGLFEKGPAYDPWTREEEPAGRDVKSLYWGFFDKKPLSSIRPAKWVPDGGSLLPPPVKPADQCPDPKKCALDEQCEKQGGDKYKKCYKPLGLKKCSHHSDCPWDKPVCGGHAHGQYWYCIPKAKPLTPPKPIVCSASPPLSLVRPSTCKGKIVGTWFVPLGGGNIFANKGLNSDVADRWLWRDDTNKFYIGQGGFETNIKPAGPEDQFTRFDWMAADWSKFKGTLKPSDGQKQSNPPKGITGVVADKEALKKGNVHYSLATNQPFAAVPSCGSLSAKYNKAIDQLYWGAYKYDATNNTIIGVPDLNAPVVLIEEKIGAGAEAAIRFKQKSYLSKYDAIVYVRHCTHEGLQENAKCLPSTYVNDPDDNAVNWRLQWTCTNIAQMIKDFKPQEPNSKAANVQCIGKKINSWKNEDGTPTKTKSKFKCKKGTICAPVGGAKIEYDPKGGQKKTGYGQKGVQTDVCVPKSAAGYLKLGADCTGHPDYACSDGKKGWPEIKCFNGKCHNVTTAKAYFGEPCEAPWSGDALLPKSPEIASNCDELPKNKNALKCNAYNKDKDGEDVSMCMCPDFWTKEGKADVFNPNGAFQSVTTKFGFAAGAKTKDEALKLGAKIRDDSTALKEKLAVLHYDCLLKYQEAWDFVASQDPNDPNFKFNKPTLEYWEGAVCFADEDCVIPGKEGMKCVGGVDGKPAKGKPGRCLHTKEIEVVKAAFGKISEKQRGNWIIKPPKKLNFPGKRTYVFLDHAFASHDGHNKYPSYGLAKASFSDPTLGVPRRQTGFPRTSTLRDLFRKYTNSIWQRVKKGKGEQPKIEFKYDYNIRQHIVSDIVDPKKIEETYSIAKINDYLLKNFSHLGDDFNKTGYAQGQLVGGLTVEETKDLAAIEAVSRATMPNGTGYTHVLADPNTGYTYPGTGGPATTTYRTPVCRDPYGGLYDPTAPNNPLPEKKILRNPHWSKNEYKDQLLNKTVSNKSCKDWLPIVRAKGGNKQFKVSINNISVGYDYSGEFFAPYPVPLASRGMSSKTGHMWIEAVGGLSGPKAKLGPKYVLKLVTGDSFDRTVWGAFNTDDSEWMTDFVKKGAVGEMIDASHWKKLASGINQMDTYHKIISRRYIDYKIGAPGKNETGVYISPNLSAEQKAEARYALPWNKSTGKLGIMRAKPSDIECPSPILCSASIVDRLPFFKPAADNYSDPETGKLVALEHMNQQHSPTLVLYQPPYPYKHLRDIVNSMEQGDDFGEDGWFYDFNFDMQIYANNLEDILKINREINVASQFVKYESSLESPVDISDEKIEFIYNGTYGKTVGMNFVGEEGPNYGTAPGKDLPKFPRSKITMGPGALDTVNKGHVEEYTSHYNRIFFDMRDVASKLVYETPVSTDWKKAAKEIGITQAVLMAAHAKDSDSAVADVRKHDALIVENDGGDIYQHVIKQYPEKLKTTKMLVEKGVWDKEFFTATNAKNFSTNLDILAHINKKVDKNLSKEWFRDYSHIMNGQLANHEIVAYKVIKSKNAPTKSREMTVADLGATTVTDVYKSEGEQEIYFFPVTEDGGKAKLIEFFDTQVELGKKYYYDLHAIVLVYGTKYKYNNPNLKENWNTVTGKNAQLGLQDSREALSRFSPAGSALAQPRDLKSAHWYASVGDSKDNKNKTFLSQLPIHAWNSGLAATPGGKLKYCNLKFSLKYVESYSISADVTQKPVVGLFEVPILERVPEVSTLAWPSHPLQPRVEIINHTSKSSTGIIVLLSSDFGEHIYRIETEYEKKEFANAIIGLRNNVDFRTKVKELYPQAPQEADFMLFNNKLPINRFIVYRISKTKHQPAPISYEEFGESYLEVQARTAGIVATDGVPVHANEVFGDTLETNRKYYYMFKALADPKHMDLKSLPTAVYGVELIEQDGKITLFTEIIELKKPDTRAKTVEFKRRIKIKPALLQAAPNKDKKSTSTASGFASGDLGFEEDPTFIEKDAKSSDTDRKPKFKFRITSKKTQRQIDINVYFRKTVHDGSATLPSTKGGVLDASGEPRELKQAKQNTIKKLKDGTIKVLLGYDRVQKFKSKKNQ
mgnify:FL=1